MYSRLCPLSERYVFDILTYIYEKESVKATDLQEIGTNYKSLKKTSAELVSIGLVDMEIVDDGKLKKVYTLTPKGKKVAKHLLQAKNELDERNVPSPPHLLIDDADDSKS